MPERRPDLTRAELPEQFTAETVRALPITTLRQLSDHHNGLLSRDEQRAFDKALGEVMRGTARRVSQQLTRADWATLRRDEKGGGQRGRPTNRTDQQLQRLARRVGQQVDLAGTLAPDVDWSFARSAPATTDTSSPPEQPDQSETSPASPTDDQHGTVDDLEQSITDQVDLIEVMSEIADMSKRTYALEQQRDLQSTRSVFFGLVVSVTVVIAGWAPLVAAKDWDERIWIVGLTVVTCIVAGLVYALVRYRQNREESADDNASDD